MELSFTGRGAAFNPKEGSNSGYFIERDNLFLIDCGESTFSRLYENGILNDINTINLMITHTHSDHVGSLGTLVMYSYFVKHKSLNIILPESDEYKNNISQLLKIYGCTNEMYNFIDTKNIDNKYETFNEVRYINTKHDDEIICYGILFNTNDGYVYYSGDTREIDIIDELINSKFEVDKIYVDTTNANYKGNSFIYWIT